MTPLRRFSQIPVSNSKFIGEFLLSRCKNQTLFPRMICSLSSKVLLISFPWRNRANPTTHFGLSFDFTLTSLSKHFSSIDVAKEIERKSFTVSYLMNSCGLSSESAKLASKRFQLRNLSNSDSVLHFLKNYGFSEADIKKLIRSYPEALALNAETNLKPKMEFFLSIGVKDDDLVTIICRNPSLLGSSLNKRIIPCYGFFKRLHVHDELVVKSLIRSSWIWKESLEKDVIPNVELLKNVGVSESSILFMMIYYFGLLSLDNAKFSKRVNRVISMGFDRSKYSFVQAIRCWPTKSTGERKARVCRSWGWSVSDISLAFRSDPCFMYTSEDKLNDTMDFLVNKMGWDPSAVAAAPHVFSRSLKKNTIPRCSVIRVLMLKGLIDEKPTLYSVIKSPKNWFLDKFVFSYLEQVPELLDIFEGKVDISELGFGFGEKMDTKFK